MSDVDLGLTGRLLARLERAALPPAVVAGTDVTGLSVARALARHGVTVLGVDDCIHRHTSYSGAWHFLRCPEGDGPGLIAYLEQLAERLPRRAVLFLSMDQHVTSVAAEGPRRLRERYHFEFPEPEAVTVLMDKGRFGALARERGWPVPRTSVCRSPEDVAEAGRDLTFPVILKPSVKHGDFRSHAPSKAFRCETPEQLQAQFRLMSQWEPEGVVQEWVPGGDDEVYFSLHYLDAGLEEVACFEGRKIRQWMPECGSTASAVGVPEQRVTELSRRILRETGCVGFGAVEYKRDPRSDRFAIIEPTVGRVDLQVGVATANHVDLVGRAYFHLIGRAYPRRERPTHDRKWILVWSDYQAARHYIRQGRSTWPEYLRSLRGPKAFAVWTLTDLPMMWALARTLATWPWRVAARKLRAWRSA